MFPTKTKKTHIVALIVGSLLFLFPSVWVMNLSRSFIELVVIGTPVIILALDGTDWLADYRFDNYIVYSLVTFWGLTALTQLIGPYPFHGLDAIRSFHLKFLCLFVTALYSVRSNRLLESFYWGLVLALVLCNMFGYFQLAFGWKALTPFWEAPPKTYVITPFGDPQNSFGNYLSFLMLGNIGFAFAKVSRAVHKNTPVLFILTNIISSIPILFFTYSRQAIGSFSIGIIIICLLASLLFSIGPKVPTTIFFSILVTILGLYWFYPSYEYQKILFVEINNLSGRVNEVWPKIWKLIVRRPYFGYDLTSDTYDLITNSVNSWRSHEHNTYLFFLLRTGLLGFLGFLALVLSGMFKSLRLIYRKGLGVREKINLLTFTTMFFTLILLIGLVSIPPNYFFELVTTFWIATILSAMNKRKKTTQIVK